MTKSMSFRETGNISCEWIETMRCCICIAHQFFFRMRLNRSEKTRTGWYWMGHSSMLMRLIYWAKK